MCHHYGVLRTSVCTSTSKVTVQVFYTYLPQYALEASLLSQHRSPVLILVRYSYLYILFALWYGMSAMEIGQRPEAHFERCVCVCQKRGCAGRGYRRAVA